MTDNPNGLAVRKSYGIYFSCEASWWSVARLSQDEEAIYDAVIRILFLSLKDSTFYFECK